MSRKLMGKFRAEREVGSEFTFTDKLPLHFEFSNLYSKHAQRLFSQSPCHSPVLII